MTTVVTIHGDPFVDPGAYEATEERTLHAQIKVELNLCRIQRLLGEMLETAAEIEGPVGRRLIVALNGVIAALPKS